MASQRAEIVNGPRPCASPSALPQGSILPMSDGYQHPSPTVFIVDDDASYRTALTRLLRASGLKVRAFGSAAEFLAWPERDVPGCLVLDLQMPGLSGLDVQEALAKAGQTMPVVFLTGHGDIPTSVQAMRRGAEDFLTKLAPKPQLLDAVQRALARDATQRAEREQREALRARFAALSARELEVLQHVLQGKLNKQIADDLNINERTVKLHRTAITTKLGVPSVAELARLWIEAGLAAD
jgi:FixJ family two-component response regulator